jgi:hypothetical protein
MHMQVTFPFRHVRLEVGFNTVTESSNFDLVYRKDPSSPCTPSSAPFSLAPFSFHKPSPRLLHFAVLKMRYLDVNIAYFTLLGMFTVGEAGTTQIDYVQPVQDQVLINLQAAEASSVLKKQTSCTLETAGVRKNW